MADKEKKVTQDSKVDKATTEESKAAEKVAKAAKGSKSKKPNFFARSGKNIKRFFKDFKGETKKIVWPDAKTVLKSTGVVLVVVTIVTAAVFLFDFGLETGIAALKEAALNRDAAPISTSTDAVETTANTQETTSNTEETTSAVEETTGAEGSEETGETEGTTAETVE